MGALFLSSSGLLPLLATISTIGSSQSRQKSTQFSTQKSASSGRRWCLLASFVGGVEHCLVGAAHHCGRWEEEDLGSESRK
jgi:hypothetical protein